MWPALGINFWGVAKCGNSAVKSRLLEASGFTDENVLGTVSVQKDEFADYVWPVDAINNGLKNFSVIRHPVCRTVSAYKDLVVSRPGRGEQAGLDINWNFDQFLDFIVNTQDETADVHFRSINWFLSEPMDIVLKLENQFEDWCFDFDKPIVVHQSQHADIEVTLQHVEKIYSRYQLDFERFNYDPMVFDCA